MTVRPTPRVKVTNAELLPIFLDVAEWLVSIHKWRIPAMKWCRKAQIRASTTSLMNQPGTNPMPLENALVNLANEISLDTDTSNIQMVNGNSKNMMKPLMRCRIDTNPAAGRR